MARGESGERGGCDGERGGVLGEEAALKILGMVVARIAEVTRDEDAAAAANITAYRRFVLLVAVLAKIHSVIPQKL